MGASGIQPEHGRGAGGAGPVDGKFYPVADRRVLGLAGTPDVAGLDVMGEQHLPVGVDHLNLAVAGDLKGFVV